MGGRLLLAALFVGAGATHFLNPRPFRAIMPDYLGWQAELVALSGAAELLLGILLLIPGARPVARWGLLALLVAVFPANLHMALHPERYAALPAWLLWLRLPLQPLLMLWVWKATAES